LVALASLRANRGASREEVTGLIDRAIRAGSGESAPHLMLVDYLLASKDPKAAVAAAQAGLAALPDDPDVLDCLARAQLAAGEHQQAINTFNKVVVLRPTATQPLLRLAEAYQQTNELDAAARAVVRALDITPDLVPAQHTLIRLALQARDPQRALKVARDVQKQRPNEATGYLFEGDIHAQFRHWDEAAAALRGGLDKTKPGALPARLHFMLNAANKPAEAQKFAGEWVRRHPDDGSFVFYLGGVALAQGDFAQAESRFRESVNIDPQNALAYNNLAWLLITQKKPGALDMANKAVALAPQEPAVLDTQALVLAEANQLAKAIETAERVVKLAPEAPVYRLNLAKLYVKSGQKQKARSELDQLAQLGAKFSGQNEVSDLLKGLGD
jgi:putative PEP-CTERM system TPR-repeat lipoprotein